MSSQQPPHPFALIDWNRINHALTYALFHGGNLPPGFMPEREPERHGTELQQGDEPEAEVERQTRDQIADYRATLEAR